MQALRLVVPALALATVLSSVFLSLGFVTASRTTDSAPRPTPNDHDPLAGASAEGSAPDKGETLSASARDVRGGPVPGLPRYPGSVRVSYAEDRVGGLAVVRAGYLAERPPSTVRDFYDRVFRSGYWNLANVEYSAGKWFFHAVRGGREVGVEVSPRGGGSMVEVEFSRPVGREEG